MYLVSKNKKGWDSSLLLTPILGMLPRRRATVAAVVAGLAIVAAQGDRNSPSDRHTSRMQALGDFQL
jgi:hypothetical protein